MTANPFEDSLIQCTTPGCEAWYPNDGWGCPICWIEANAMDLTKFENDRAGEAVIHQGEKSTANNKPLSSRRAKRRTLPKVDVSKDLYDFLEVNREANERSMTDEIRFWLKQATGIRT